MLRAARGMKKDPWTQKELIDNDPGKSIIHRACPTSQPSRVWVTVAPRFQHSSCSHRLLTLLSLPFH